MAFFLSDANLRLQFKERYELTKALYYKGQPDFDNILERISTNLYKL